MAPLVPKNAGPQADEVDVAVVHDYLTQRGGAERVVLDLLGAFPGATVRTALYDPRSTFPEFTEHEVRCGWLNEVPGLRRNHRRALPLLASWFSRQLIDADVTFCSSSGWAHGVRTTGRKVVYCHTPARWLYQPERYLGSRPSRVARLALGALGSPLRRWDRRASASAHRYLANSSEVARRIQDLYRRPAEVLIPPPGLSPSSTRAPREGLEPGYWLCVSRLLPYKNVDAVVRAFAGCLARRLVVVGEGPELPRLAAIAGSNVLFAGAVPDDELAWLYANCQAVVSASYEDLGLVPLEAAGFAKPVAALRFGGHLDTVVEGETGVLFEHPSPLDIRNALGLVESTTWSPEAITAHAATFARPAFTRRLWRIACEEASVL